MKIIYQGGIGEITEKKSRFICSVERIATEDEAMDFINRKKKQYWDARHNCFAYVLGAGNEKAKFSDDGEPQGTAGKPMLDVLTAKGIHNAVVVVTRYFGGVLLGTGGLIRAYQAAVKAGLDNSTVIERKEGEKYSVSTDYNGMGKIRYISEKEGYFLLDTVYTDKVEMILLVEKGREEEFVKKITEAASAKAEIVSVGTVSYGISQMQELILLS